MRRREHIPLFWNFLKEVGGRVPIIVEIKLEGKKGCDDLSAVRWLIAVTSMEGLACIGVPLILPACAGLRKPSADAQGRLSGNYRRAHWGRAGFFNFTLTACMFNFLYATGFCAHRLEDAHTGRSASLRNFCRACTVAWIGPEQDDLEGRSREEL